MSYSWINFINNTLPSTCQIESDDIMLVRKDISTEDLIETSLSEYIKTNNVKIEQLENKLMSISHLNYNYKYLAGRSFYLRLINPNTGDFFQVMAIAKGQGQLSDRFIKILDSIDQEAINKILICNPFRADNTYEAVKFILNYKIVGEETPSFIFMRFAIFIFENDLPKVERCFQMLNNFQFIAPAPALAYAGTVKSSLVSTCYVYSRELSGPEGLIQTGTDLSKQYFGGAGIHLHEVPASKFRNYVKLLSELVLLDYDPKRHYRTPSYSFFMEPWHLAINEFLELKNPLGDENEILRDSHIGLVIPDEFMRRVQNRSDWSLFDPETLKTKELQSLASVYGDDFTNLYNQYENDPRIPKTKVDARQLWGRILVMQIKSGEPYIIYKDAVNTKTNENVTGKKIIRGTNLCCEVLQYCDDDYTAVCNVMTLSAPSYFSEASGSILWEELRQGAKFLQLIGDNLINRMLEYDHPDYPLSDAAKKYMQDFASMGIGLNGVTDVVFKYKYSYDSKEAIETHRKLYEHLYHGLLEGSMERARELEPYKFWKESPMARGLLQFDLWSTGMPEQVAHLSWDELRGAIMKYGLRNSQLSSQPPSAGGSIFLNTIPAAEPLVSNLFVTKTPVGDNWWINRHLYHDFKTYGLDWREALPIIIRDRGSIQNVELTGLSCEQQSILDKLKSVYRTIWEIMDTPKNIDLYCQYSAVRGQFLDQSEAFNIFLRNPDVELLDRFHLSSWKYGLKTGMYYLKMGSARDSVQHTVDMDSSKLSQVTRLPSDFLMQDSRKYTLFPIIYHDIWEFYKTLELLTWKSEEIDYSKDLEIFNSLDEPTQKVIKKILTFFAVSDGLVNEIIQEHFLKEVKIKEVIKVYTSQSLQECVHEEVYGTLITKLIADVDERDRLFNEWENSTVIKNKIEFGLQYANEECPFKLKLLTNVAIEGIMFSSSFAFIYYLSSVRRLDKMHGLIGSNEFISRDEGLHRDFGCFLYRKFFFESNDQPLINEIVDKAVQIEIAFIVDLLSIELPEMNAELMSDYVKLVADNLLLALGFPKLYNVVNPFPWMDMISVDFKTDQFHKRNTNYQNAGVTSKKIESSKLDCKLLPCQGDSGDGSCCKV